jgi:hypothetical protein
MIVRMNGNPIEDISQAADRLHQATEAWDAFVYWINPAHWWEALGAYVVSPDAFFSVTIAVCLLIGLWALGAKWPKKVIFWGSLTFWLLRGVIFG